MALSGAQQYDPVNSGLQATFGSSFDEHAYGVSVMMRQGNLSEETSASDTDRYDCNPWTMGVLKRSIMNKIAHGQYDAAIRQIEKHMSFSETHASGTLKTLDRALETLKDSGFEYQAQDFIRFLSDTQLGMDIEFHNTGPNSPGSTDDTGEIRRLRHSIEAHYNNHRYTPQGFVPQYLGISTGPK